MAFPAYLNKQELYALAEWIITGMALIFGIHYLKQIIAFVLMELYKLIIQRNILPY